MADPFVAEVRAFAFNFPPKGWAFCNGQLLPISQNTALFSLLGTNFGGDGKSTFGLPDLQGRVAIGSGAGYVLGAFGGSETVTLLESELPGHYHRLLASSLAGSTGNPTNNTLARATIYANGNTNQVAMAGEALAPAGGGLPHNNMQPTLTLQFCIALQGVFPSRP